MNIKVRKTIKEDREAIGAMLVRAEVFNRDEIDCALELVDIYLNNPSQKDYLLASAVINKSGVRSRESEVENQEVKSHDSSEVVGYVCYGKAPLTKGAYDLYWIAVEPEYQREGAGRILLDYVESDIRKLSARMLLAETSSRTVYEKTRRFYIKNGFLEEARVKDFYSTGDDKIIYKKILAAD
jgi:ribosomal protein S18 acetylase RimI-like enzyme